MEDIHKILTELQGEAHNLKSMYEYGRERSYINILIYGRILINHVQKKLENYDKEKFENWFHRYRLEIFGKPADEAKEKNLPDKVLDFFIKARDELEHEEIPRFTTTMAITSLTLPADLGPKPPNATGVFVDGFGVGWQVKNSDGTLGKLYVTLPENKVKTTVKPVNLNSVDDKTLESIFSIPLDERLKYYVNYLNDMVNDAVRVFS